MVKKMWFSSALALVAVAFFVPAHASEKVSAVAPIEDLTTEITAQIKDFETNLEDAGKFKAKSNARGRQRSRDFGPSSRGARRCFAHEEVGR